MRSKIVITYTMGLLLFFLAVCGNDNVHITYHTGLTYEQVSFLAGEPALGHASWSPMNPEWWRTDCDVYLMNPVDYLTEACYNAIVGHEQRHCYEGHFHAGTVGWEPACSGWTPNN